MDIYLNDVLRWLHILAMVYWLGGEWGVFQTSYKITDHRLSLDERRRHMETAYRIDILARTGIILLLPLGFHMGANLGAHPWADTPYIVTNWVLAALWLSLCWGAFIKRETDVGISLTIWDERIRYVLIPALLGISVYSLFNDAPLTFKWYAAKVFIYGLMLIIGLGLRFIMRHWTTIFREIAIQGATPALEGRLQREITAARVMAYIYWIGIATTCFIGSTKFF
jgi:hypothetical protein